MLAAEHTAERPAPTARRYVEERSLGEGGMGVVVLARDTVLSRQVALKRLLPQHRTDPQKE